jgi:hypothetical protein
MITSDTWHIRMAAAKVIFSKQTFQKSLKSLVLIRDLYLSMAPKVSL